MLVALTAAEYRVTIFRGCLYKRLR